MRQLRLVGAGPLTMHLVKPPQFCPYCATALEPDHEYGTEGRCPNDECEVGVFWVDNAPPLEPDA